MTNLNKNKSTCIVVGAGGFIGFNLCIELVKSYECIYACDTFFSDVIHSQLKASGIKIIEGGISGFLLSLKEVDAIQDVFYFAGKSTPSLLEPELSKGCFSDQENLVVLLEGCVTLSNFKSFIYGSSGGTVYGEGETICNENDSLKPISAYGLSKQLQENYITYYARKYSFSYKIARISNPYGRVLTHGSKQLQGFIDTSLNIFIKNKSIEIWGDGSVVRDYIFISDLVTAINILANKNVPDGAYNIGGGKGYSLNTIINIYRDLNLCCSVDYLKARKLDVKSNILDIKKIQKYTDWSPSFTLDKGIKTILRHIS